MKKRQIELDGVDLLLLAAIGILLVGLLIFVLPPIHIQFHSYWFSWRWLKTWYWSRWWQLQWVNWVVAGCLAALVVWVLWRRNRRGV